MAAGAAVNLSGETIASLSSLEPLAGAGFAMCLAYLALNRFRHRQAIEDAASKIIDKLDAEGDGEPDVPDFVDKHDNVCELKWLCRRPSNGFSPIGGSANIYRIFFRRHIDVFIISVLAFLAVFTLTCGVALNIGRWEFLAEFGSDPWVGRLFYLCLAALCVPPVAVWAGNHCQNWGRARAYHLDGQIALVMSARAKTAAAPPVPANQPPAEITPFKISVQRGKALTSDEQVSRERSEALRRALMQRRARGESRE